MNPMNDDDIEHWDAAYVLGALSPQDRQAYEDYLADNPQRTDDLAEFSALPGILNALSREEALALAEIDDGQPQAPVVDLMPSLARAAEMRQRRSRRAVMALVGSTAAAFLAVGVIVTAVVLGRSGETTTPTLQAMNPAGRGGVAAAIAVSEKKWGTRLDWMCEYTKDWSKDVGSYDLVVTTTDGKQTTVASWSPEGDKSTDLSASTVIPASQIRQVDIRVAGSNDPLAVTTLR